MCALMRNAVTSRVSDIDVTGGGWGHAIFRRTRARMRPPDRRGAPDPPPPPPRPRESERPARTVGRYGRVRGPGLPGLDPSHTASPCAPLNLTVWGSSEEPDAAADARAYPVPRDAVAPASFDAIAAAIAGAFPPASGGID